MVSKSGRARGGISVTYQLGLARLDGQGGQKRWMEKYNVGTSNLDPHQFVEIEFYFREIVFFAIQDVEALFQKAVGCHR